MDFVVVIMLSPDLRGSNPNLTPIYLSRQHWPGSVLDRHSGTPPLECRDNPNNIQTFHVTKSQYAYYQCFANFPESISGIEEYLNI
jgi:hypothetical protein